MRNRLAFLTVLSFCVAGSASAAPAKHVEVEYEISRNGNAVADMVEKLEHDGKTYRLSGQLRGRGVFALRGDASRTSRGSIGPGGLRPAEFEDKRTGRDTARATFDWAAKTMTLQGKEGASETKPLPPDIQDRLSFGYQFAFHPPGAAPVGVSVTDGKGVSTSTYKSVGKETVKTPAGEFEALKLEREKKDAGDRTTEIWLATRLGMVPVRILVVEKDGTRIDQVATRVTPQ